MCDFSSYGGPSEEWIAIQANLPSPGPDPPLSDFKRAMNEGREQVASQEMESLSSQIRMRDHSIPTRDGLTIEGRSYRPSAVDDSQRLPVYIHFHGGGFLFGTLASEDAACARIVIGTGVVVVNVNYRHTPEYTYPTAWNDAQDAFEWVHDHINDIGGDAQNVIVGGISAGAQLTASLVLEKHLGRAATSYPAVAGQVLMIPCMVSVDAYEPQLRKMKDKSISSYTENIDAPILPVSRVRYFTDLLKVGTPDVMDTKINPGNATPEAVRGLPPTTFGIAGLDPLRDEGLLYAKMLADSGYAI